MNETHRNCIVCGKKFRVRKRYGEEAARSEPQKFCTRACYSKYRRDHKEAGKVVVHCAKCGKELRRWPAHARTVNYCSKSCANSANFNDPHKKPEQRRKPPQPQIAKTCEECGKTFYVFPYRKNNARFCSRKCAYKNRRIDDSFTNFRERALNTFPHACMICGFDIAVQVHHVIPRRIGGSNGIDNAVILCPNHHAMADRGMLSADLLTSLNHAAIAALSDHQHQSDQPLSVQPESVQPMLLSAESGYSNQSD